MIDEPFQAKPKTTCERQNCKAVMAVVVLFGIMIGVVLAQTDDLLNTEVAEESSEEEESLEATHETSQDNEAITPPAEEAEDKQEAETGENKPVSKEEPVAKGHAKKKARVMSIEELAALTQGAGAGGKIQTTGYAMPSSVRPGMVRIWDRDWRTWIVCQANQSSPLPETWNEDTAIEAQGVLSWGEDGVAKLDSCIVNAT